MSDIVCHRCNQPCLNSGFSYISVWVGVIEAKKEDLPHCFECILDLRAEKEERSSWEVEGEGWKEEYNPDDENGEEWKDKDA
jgi:hypothetical protein